MRRRIRATTCTAVLVLTVGITACGKDDPTRPAESTDRSSGSPSSSESSSAAGSDTSSGNTSSDAGDLPDDLPAEAHRKTEEGAAAFGEYYFKAYGDATHTGDTAIIEMLHASDCTVCTNGVADISADAAKGWTRSINPYTISNVQVAKRPDEGYKVSMAVKVKAHKRLDSSGQPNGTIDATGYKLTEHLVWRGGRWHIQDWIAT